METKSTIAELLADISLLKKRISKEGDTSYSNDVFVSIYKGPAPQILVDGNNADEFSANAKKIYDQSRSLTENLRKLIAIKGIVNDIVKVTIAGEEYTINQALAYLNGDVRQYYDTLIKNMSRNLLSCKNRVSRYNQDALTPERINDYLRVCLGSQAAVDDARKARPEEVQEFTDKYIERNTCHFFDPIGIEKELNTLSEWYDKFYTTAEKALAVVNAQTMIVYDLDDPVPNVHSIIYARFD